jgi:hypothetical protein
MVAIFAVLLWYVGITALIDAILTIKIEYLLLAFLMYFGINVFSQYGLDACSPKMG